MSIFWPDRRRRQHGPDGKSGAPSDDPPKTTYDPRSCQLCGRHGTIVKFVLCSGRGLCVPCIKNAFFGEEARNLVTWPWAFRCPCCQTTVSQVIDGGEVKPLRAWLWAVSRRFRHMFPEQGPPQPETWI